MVIRGLSSYLYVFSLPHHLSPIAAKAERALYSTPRSRLWKECAKATTDTAPFADPSTAVLRPVQGSGRLFALSHKASHNAAMDDDTAAAAAAAAAATAAPPGQLLHPPQRVGKDVDDGRV